MTKGVLVRPHRTIVYLRRFNEDLIVDELNNHGAVLLHYDYEAQGPYDHPYSEHSVYFPRPMNFTVGEVLDGLAKLLMSTFELVDWFSSHEIINLSGRSLQIRLLMIHEMSTKVVVDVYDQYFRYNPDIWMASVGYCRRGHSRELYSVPPEIGLNFFAEFFGLQVAQ